MVLGPYKKPYVWATNAPGADCGDLGLSNLAKDANSQVATGRRCRQHTQFDELYAGNCVPKGCDGTLLSWVTSEPRPAATGALAACSVERKFQIQHRDRGM